MAYDLRSSSAQPKKLADEVVAIRTVDTTVENPAWNARIEELRSQFDENCGAACLHVLLRLSGIVQSKQEVYNEVAVTSQGASLAELQSAAAKFGLACEVREVSVSELWKLQPPLIIHLKEDKQHPGHYLVMYSIDETKLAQLIESTTGDMFTMTEPMLYEAFSGHVLVPVVRWSLLLAFETLSLVAVSFSAVTVAVVALSRARFVIWPRGTS